MPTEGQPDPTVGGPLGGVRVIDCSTVLAGPLCTMLLADLGADVVKVEPPEGDPTRTWGPPWLDGPAGERVAAYFLSVNRNKRSLRLDLKHPDGRAVLEELLRPADVVVENFRVGGFARLGFDDDRLAQLNPALVHLAITGYGPQGPNAHRPGYDFVVQAMAGLMSITGASDADGGGPTKVGVAISDVATGLFGAIGILSALLARDRSPSAAPAGRGQRVDVSILESTLAVLVNQAQNAFITGRAPGRMGNAHPNIVPYETFETSDGEIALAVGSERQWQRLCDALGEPQLATDPRFATNGDRVTARGELRPLLAARFAQDTSRSWLTRLDAAEIPAGPINDIPTAFADPQSVARDMAVDVVHPTLGPIRQVGLPLKLSGTPGSIRSAPPLLGEHTSEILSELGYPADRIAQLRSAGVV